jgi:RNA polymerase sigma-70 factor (ECF subfamily)
MDVNLFEIDDSLLLSRVVFQQDKIALATLYLKYSPKVKSYIGSYIHSITDTEDLAQDVFLQICRGKGNYNSSKGAEHYIFGIAKNVIRKYQREKEKSPESVPADSLNGFFPKHHVRESTDPKSQITEQQFRKIIEVIQTGLPPKAREAVRLRFIEGLSPKEAAKKGGCSINAFYKRLQRAVKILHKICMEEG